MNYLIHILETMRDTLFIILIGLGVIYILFILSTSHKTTDAQPERDKYDDDYDYPIGMC